MITVLARLVADRQSLVWVLLVAATVLTAVIGLEQRGGTTAVGVTLLVIAFVKIRLVAMYFMEIRYAPGALRLIVETWVALTLVALVALYVFA